MRCDIARSPRRPRRTDVACRRFARHLVRKLTERVMRRIGVRLVGLLAVSAICALSGCTPHGSESGSGPADGATRGTTSVSANHAIGLVHGWVAACNASLARLPAHAVQVVARRPGSPSASTTVIVSGLHVGHYRLRLSPGRYVIAAAAEHDGPRVVVVRADKVSRVDLSNPCG
jgi:hypothetical protein